jgi:hypothetical protein
MDSCGSPTGQVGHSRGVLCTPEGSPALPGGRRSALEPASRRFLRSGNLRGAVPHRTLIQDTDVQETALGRALRECRLWADMPDPSHPSRTVIPTDCVFLRALAALLQDGDRTSGPPLHGLYAIRGALRTKHRWGTMGQPSRRRRYCLCLMTTGSLHRSMRDRSPGEWEQEPKFPPRMRKYRIMEFVGPRLSNDGRTMISL